MLALNGEIADLGLHSCEVLVSPPLQGGYQRPQTIVPICGRPLSGEISRQLAFSNSLQSALLLRLANGSGQRFQRSSLATLSPRP